MKKVRTNELLAASLCLLVLGGCSQNQGTATSTAAKPPAQAAGTGSTAGATAAAPTGNAASQPATATSDKTATTNGATPAGLPPQVHMDLAQLPDDLVICTVGSHPVTVAEYRTALKVQQVALEPQLAGDAQTRAALLAAAARQNVTITADERKRLVEAAKKGHGKDFENFLKAKKMSESDFENAVAEEGVEYKMAEMQVEQDLLGQLLRRSMLAQAATAEGRTKEAQKNVAKIEASPQVKVLETRTGLSKAVLHEEMLQTELARLQLVHVIDSAAVSDKDVQAFYDQHKSQLKHGERIRMSSILIAAPDKDFGPVKSVRAQVQKANPKLAGKDLDTAVNNVMNAQQNKALILLTEARLPKADFAKLANKNTNDALAHAKQNGGDMGWSDKSQLDPKFVSAVWDLNPGDIVPKLIRTDEGFRIIKITGKEKAASASLAEVKPILVEKLKQDKEAAIIQDWIKQQQQKMPVKFTDRFLALAKQESPTH